MRHLLLIISVLIWASVSVADICSHLPGYSSYGQSCFKLYTITKTWAAAEASCVADGGHLASIHSSEEHAFLINFVASSRNIWIGVSGVPPDMTWSDNTDMDYDPWRSGEPNLSCASCGMMRGTHSHQTGDRHCTETVPYVCRADVSDGTDQTQAYFTKIPGGVPKAAGVLASSSLTVRSAIQCSVRCKQDAQCVHFILTEDGGKYRCETYTSLYRPQAATSPTNNYQRIV